jgi:hypothetical protein
MEQSDSTGRVPPYQLATLASRICPELCVSDPKEAIAFAERLLCEAREAIHRAHQEEGRKDFERHEAELGREAWITALKEITGQKRRDRAVERFLAYAEHEESAESKQLLNSYKRDGFPISELLTYRELFRNWLKQPKRKKGKQGRRISEHDRRVRIGSFHLAARKPPKPN